MAFCSTCLSADDTRSKQIEKEIKKDRKDQEDEIKLLLLGAGESGKSTIFKQMKIIHQKGYTQEERASFRAIVHSNTIQCIKILVEASETFEFDLSEHAATVERVNNMALNIPLTPQLAHELSALWKSQPIQDSFARASEYQLPDSASFFLNDLQRICQLDFVPTEQDVLRTRVRTTGIVETSWTMGGKNADSVVFRMFDVGGQRNERRKWIHCFDNVTAVIFVAALSEYDQVLFEDETQNRMMEALNLFDQICNSRWFSNTAMILFLNKVDLFREKVENVNLRVCFPDFKGNTGDEAAALDYIQTRFKALNRHPTRQIYVHVTCATDTTNIRFVFEVIRDVVMQINMQDCGF